MYFKNATIYGLDTANISAEHLADKLSTRRFQPCGSQDMVSRGWTSPTDDDRFVLAVTGHFLFSMTVEQKILPAAVINQVAAEKAELIKDQQGYKPGRKQMKEIKEAVLQELLPKAFTRRKRIFVWIDTHNNLIAIDTPSPRVAEDVIDALRITLDALPIELIRTAQSPTAAMTGWLAGGEAPGAFTIDQDCELRAVTDEKAAVRYVHHSLDGNDVRDHLAAGKLPTRVALTFDDRVAFVLTDKMVLKRIAFLDVVKEEAGRQAETADMQIEAEFALMSGELSRMFKALVEALGGTAT